MVLDEPKEADEVFAVNGFTMLMDKALSEQTKDVTIDYGMHGCGSGFKLTSEVPIAGAGSGSSCSC
jgi:iron-sulfur cluster assembly protein